MFNINDRRDLQNTAGTINNSKTQNWESVIVELSLKYYHLLLQNKCGLTKKKGFSFNAYFWRFLLKRGDFPDIECRLDGLGSKYGGACGAII